MAPRLHVNRKKKKQGAEPRYARCSGSITPSKTDGYSEPSSSSACVRGKLNILISGGSGTGKTTLLNAVSAFIPNEERIITIEDAAELQLAEDYVVTLESRPPNIEGRGQIRELVRNALRMRPDRIVVGRSGAETLDMLQAMNTGHEGSLTTIHANSPRDALARTETLVLTVGVDLAGPRDPRADLERLRPDRPPGAAVDGSRRVSHITEVLRMESDVITLQDVFKAKMPAKARASAPSACSGSSNIAA